MPSGRKKFSDKNCISFRTAVSVDGCEELLPSSQIHTHTRSSPQRHTGNFRAHIHGRRHLFFAGLRYLVNWLHGILGARDNGMFGPGIGRGGFAATNCHLLHPFRQGRHSTCADTGPTCTSESAFLSVLMDGGARLRILSFTLYR